MDLRRIKKASNDGGLNGSGWVWVGLSGSEGPVGLPFNGRQLLLGRNHFQYCSGGLIDPM